MTLNHRHANVSVFISMRRTRARIGLCFTAFTAKCIRTTLVLSCQNAIIPFDIVELILPSFVIHNRLSLLYAKCKGKISFSCNQKLSYKYYNPFWNFFQEFLEEFRQIFTFFSANQNRDAPSRLLFLFLFTALRLCNSRCKACEPFFACFFFPFRKGLFRPFLFRRIGFPRM